MTLLDAAWSRAWHDLGLAAPARLKDALLSAWNQPQRRYHTRQHLEECLVRFNEARELAERPGEVAIALWFHDAVYALKGKDNERRSADWARAELAKAGAAEDVIERVDALVTATCHDAAPRDADAQLLVDIDLAILGATPARFAEYDAQMAAEYAWVPRFVYRFKRRQVLRGFLARPAIYSTEYFHDRLERQARTNLAAATR